MANDKKQETKPKKPSALKRDQQAERKRVKNKQFRACVRTAVRALHTALKEKQDESAKEKLSTIFSLMDKGVKTGVFTKNKANRTKSRLAKVI